MPIGFDAETTKKEVGIPLWEYPWKIDYLQSTYVGTAFLTSLIQKAIAEDRKLECLYFNQQEAEVTFDKVEELLVGLGGSVRATTRGNTLFAKRDPIRGLHLKGNDDGGSGLVFNEDWVAIFRCSWDEPKQYLEFHLYTLNQSIVQPIKDYLASVARLTVESRVYLLKVEDGEIGYTSRVVDFESRKIENYSPRTNLAIDEMMKQIAAPNPFGRLVILDGPPGTGKTHLVQSLIGEMKAASLVLPPSMIQYLGKPDLIPALEDLWTAEKKPIVLIVEDADEMLQNREKDNQSAIASTLNLTDGILGRLFDIRIIATSNIQIDNIDPALLRPGRLLKRITVGLLPSEQAKAIFERELPGKDIPEVFDTKSEFSLAEVYEAIYLVSLVEAEVAA